MPSSNVSIEWNLDAFEEFRSGPPMQAELRRRGRAILDGCGGEAEGYGMEGHHSADSPQGRYRVTVFADTEEARVENARDNTLVRNFGRARG